MQAALVRFNAGIHFGRRNPRIDSEQVPNRQAVRSDKKRRGEW